MNVHFNLVDEPWLPCTALDGIPTELGLYETLARAHELRELHGETPLETAALHRLLLAVLHRVVDGPRSAKAWGRLWERGRWDEAALQAYLELWRDRFDLFDGVHPFYQCADPPNEPKPINSLSLTLTYNSTLFEHQLQDGTLSIPPVRAARWLVTLQASGIGTGPPFDPYPAGTLTNSLIIIPQGRNLFETLAFNLIEYHDNKPIPAVDEDRPIWEYEQNPFPPSPKAFYFPGYLGYLTWQCRTIKLVPAIDDGEIQVRECYLTQGARWDRSIEDPMKVYHIAKKREVGMLPLRIQEGRALWRDSDTLLRLNTQDVRPPVSFLWLAEHVQYGTLDAAQIYDYTSLGLSNDNAKLFFYREERMPLPLVYLQDETLAEQVRLALLLAENVNNALSMAGLDLAKWIASPKTIKRVHKQDYMPIFAQLDLDRRYWPRLDVPFQTFIRDLPGERQAALDRWVDVVCNTARRAFNEAADGVAEPTRGLKAITMARGTLERLMASTLNPKPA